MAQTPGSEPKFFATQERFRAWLERNAVMQPEVIVGFHKTGAGKPSMTWPESVDEALCFGWIDGVRRRIDDETYQIRFTPRRPDSIWSAVNLAKVERLIAEGRMTPAGLAVYKKRKPEKSAIYSFEQQGELHLAPEAEIRFKRNRPAWAFFQTTPPSYRKVAIHWVNSAKRDVTRERRLQRLIEACAASVRLR
ncbi:MAG: YdeI/OmpD-associated family protein [Betaproteobacteria bacterium]|nr:YdeI/OmpD-associated family protein [Betaproteobacteria bacterium]